MGYISTPEHQIAVNISAALHLVGVLPDSIMKEALFAAFESYRVELFRRKPRLLH